MFAVGGKKKIYPCMMKTRSLKLHIIVYHLFNYPSIQKDSIIRALLLCYHMHIQTH